MGVEYRGVRSSQQDKGVAAAAAAAAAAVVLSGSSHRDAPQVPRPGHCAETCNYYPQREPRPGDRRPALTARPRSLPVKDADPVSHSQKQTLAQ